MGKHAIVKAAAILAIGVLHGCGGGGSGGGAAFPMATAPVASPASAEASVPASAPSPAAPPAAAPAPSAAPVASLRRALDTVSPVAVNGDLDIELSPAFASAVVVTYSLENPDGTNAGTVSLRGGSAGLFFPHTASLVKLLMPKVNPGSYVLRAKGQILNFATATSTYVEATMPVELNTLSLNLASLSYSSGLVIGGSSRFLSLTYTSDVSGTLFFYPTGHATGVCASKTAAELALVPDVKTFAVTGSANSSSGALTSATSFADADTGCLQFVRASDSVAEAPYTFNFRYQPLPTSGDLIFSLDADPAAIAKSAISLMSMPRSVNSSGFFDWLERRQVFTSGDVLQQTTANSARISLEQAGGTWQYRLTAPVATDHPYYVAKIEGRPPLVLFVKP